MLVADIVLLKHSFSAHEFWATCIGSSLYCICGCYTPTALKSLSLQEPWFTTAIRITLLTKRRRQLLLVKLRIQNMLSPRVSTRIPQ